MENRGVLIGSIIFVFASFVLMMVMLIYETYKGKEELAKLTSKSQTAKPRVIAPVQVQDFSMYRTLVGDEGREMVEIPEGPFTMGHDQGDPDEAPAHPVYVRTYFYRSQGSHPVGIRPFCEDDQAGKAPGPGVRGRYCQTR